MVSDVMLRPELPHLALTDFGSRHSPILFLEDAEDHPEQPRLSDLIRASSGHGLFRQRSSATATLCCPPMEVPALIAWDRLVERFDTSCIGLIAEGGSGVADACRLLGDTVVDGTGPGAVVLLGFTRDLVATCEDVAATVDRRGGRSAGPGRYASTTLFEWPSMMIFLPEDDQTIGECAGACRAMRSLGVPIRLEVMGSMRGPPGARTRAAEELVTEIDRFFVGHLTTWFPRLP